MGEADRPAADSRDFDAARIRRLEYSNERPTVGFAEQLGAAHAEIDDLRTKVRAAVRVLLEFAGRLGVTDAELADLLAEAEMRTKGRPCP
jgi:hypothetical protein